MQMKRWRFAWAWLIGAVLLSGACHVNPKPPQPPTPPTPTPTPPTGTPPKGQPQGPERLLRIVDGPRLQTNDGKPFEVFMAAPCCMGWAKVDNQRWPMASEAFMDETGKYGANMFHFRIGPWFGDEDHESEWKDIGGAYLTGTSEWNSVFWVAVRQLAWHAYEQGSYVEVVPVDDWWLKGACGRDADCGKKVPWPDADVKAWGHTPTPEAERLYRKTISELGCFGNVIWTTGNEEDLIPGMTAEHVNWRVSIMRDEEQKSGCGFVHIIGTGSWKDGITADYSITHERSAVTGPCQGRFCVNNEHNEEFSPKQEAGNFKQARDAHQVWAAWRSGAEDPAWEHRLELFKSVVDGSAPPTVGCFPPPDDGAWTIVQEGPPGTRADEVRAAQAELGSMCKETLVHQNGIDAIRALNDRLRTKGYCAGFVGSEDAVMILSENSVSGGTLWEEHHAVAPFDTGCWSTSNAHYPKNIWKYTGQWAAPAPPSTTCTNPEAVPVDHCIVKEHTKGPNWTTLDVTFKVHNAAYCAVIGSPNLDCPVRLEGDPLREVCEAEAVGRPLWTGLPGGQIDPANPYLYRVPRGTSGQVTTCASKHPQACCSVQVTP